MRPVPTNKEGEPIIIPEVKIKERPDYVTQEREYELITPLFGGGVEPGTADPVTVIRATEIRGHLRFWWRATRGGQFDGNLEEMKKAEDKLWGAASKPDYLRVSEVRVSVRITNEGKPEIPFEVIRNEKNGKPKLKQNTNVAPPYAAFPLQPKSEEMNIGWKSKPLLTKVRFILTLTYPQQKAKEVEAAVWAWELLGGVGARTRRGFGAIHLVNGNELIRLSESVNSVKEVMDWLTDVFKKSPYIQDENPPDNISHLRLNPYFEITDLNRSAHGAWSELINAYRDFRQQRPDGDPKNRIPPGRSKWPEPEYIREITGQRLPKHQEIADLQKIERFPRAAFGLPIIFQFKDQSRQRPPNPWDRHSDPRSTLLRLEDSERLASPLILRPLKLGKDRYVGIALALDGAMLPDQMMLQLEDSGLEERFKRQSQLPRKGLRADMSDDQAKSLKMKENDKPLMCGENDVVIAFLEFLKSRRKNK